MISAAAERTMRALILALVLVLTAAPALAQRVIPPEDCPKHVGETLTVEGTVSEVHIASRSGVTFINMGGRFPNEAFTGVIFKDDASKFPGVDSLTGKVIDITGRVQDYKGRCEIILNDAAQLKVK
jgi:DNA/RNA endonuclease YhcR with UshA esterase domain